MVLNHLPQPLRGGRTKAAGGEITNYSPKNCRRAFSESNQRNQQGLLGVRGILNNPLLDTGVNSYK